MLNTQMWFLIHFSTENNIPFKTPVDIIRHKKKHAELFQGNELHVPLISKTAAQPLKKSFRIWIGHLNKKKRHSY